jgi:signal transduction histidine kinase
MTTVEATDHIPSGAANIVRWQLVMAISLLIVPVSAYTLYLEVYRRTGSPWLFALAWLLDSTMYMAVQLIIGPYLERFNRQRALQAALAATAAVTAVGVILHAAGLWGPGVMLAMIPLLGIGTAVARRTHRALVSALPQTLQTYQNYVLSLLTNSVTGLLAPAVAAMAWVLVGQMPIWWVAAGMVAGALLMTMRTRLPAVPVAEGAGLSLRQFVSDVFSGLSISLVRRQEFLFYLILTGANLFVSGTTELTPVLLIDRDPALTGLIWVMAAQALGSLVGVWAVQRWPGFRRDTWTLAAAFGLAGLGLIVTGLSRTWWGWATGLFLFLFVTAYMSVFVPASARANPVPRAVATLQSTLNTFIATCTQPVYPFLILLASAGLETWARGSPEMAAVVTDLAGAQAAQALGVVWAACGLGLTALGSLWLWHPAFRWVLAADFDQGSLPLWFEPTRDAVLRWTGRVERATVTWRDGLRDGAPWLVWLGLVAGIELGTRTLMVALGREAGAGDLWRVAVVFSLAALMGWRVLRQARRRTTQSVRPVADTLTRSGSPEMMADAVRQVAAGVGASRAVLVRANSTGAWDVVLTLGSPPTPEIDRALARPVGHEPVLREDARRDRAWFQALPWADAIVPLHGQLEISGYLLLGRAPAQVRDYSSTERAFLEQASSLLGMALQSAGLRETILSQHELGQRMVEERLETVAEQLHGGPLQSVATFRGLIRRAQTAASDQDRGQVLDQLARGMRQFETELRTATSNLRPQTQAATISGLVIDTVQDIARRAPDLQLQYELQVPQSLALDDERMYSLYTILRNALNNVVKHARASHAWVTVRQEDRALWLVVEDNGIGMPPLAPLAELLRDRHFGMAEMRRHAERLGSELVIARRTAGGTAIRLVVSL